MWAQHVRVVEQLAERLPDDATHPADAGTDVLDVTAFPKERWRQIRRDQLTRAIFEWIECRCNLRRRHSCNHHLSPVDDETANAT